MNATITFYGYPDNDDGDGHYGTAVIAHRLDWQGRARYRKADGSPVAGGRGTFEDPITAAASRNNRHFPPGTLVYIPSLQKYFFVEDECATCSHERWLDLWMDSDEASDSVTVEARQSELTGDLELQKTVVIDPPAGLRVDRSLLLARQPDDNAGPPTAKRNRGVKV